MKEELITFETAKLAKEKGFDLVCMAHYKSREFIPFFWGSHNFNDPLFEDSASAPTQSLLQKWLREEKKTIVEVTPFDDWNNWVFKILQEDIMSPFFIASDNEDEFNTYEEALEKGLIDALKLIK